MKTRNLLAMATLAVTAALALPAAAKEKSVAHGARRNAREREVAALHRCSSPLRGGGLADRRLDQCGVPRDRDRKSVV